MSRDRYLRWVLAGGFPTTLTAIVFVLTLMLRSDHVIGLSRLIAIVVVSGVAAMILIETVKRLFPVRALFQRRLVHQCFRHDSPLSQVLRRMEAEGSAAFFQENRADIGGIFNLPTEQLIPQLAAAARISAPYRVEERFEQYRSIRRTDEERRRREEEISLAVQSWEEALAQELDRLQVRLSGRWRHYLRSTAVWLSGAIALLLTSIHVSEIPDSRSVPITSLIFGGFIAWLARDITAAVERMRR